MHDHAIRFKLNLMEDRGQVSAKLLDARVNIQDVEGDIKVSNV